eukprot:5073080-Alexandrium_andersonii.AAC.1
MKAALIGAEARGLGLHSALGCRARQAVMRCRRPWGFRSWPPGAEATAPPSNIMGAVQQRACDAFRHPR